MRLVLPRLETLEFVQERMRVIKHYERTSLGESLKAGIQNTFRNQFPVFRVIILSLSAYFPKSGELTCESNGRKSVLCNEEMLSRKDTAVVREISLSTVSGKHGSQKTCEDNSACPDGNLTS